MPSRRGYKATARNGCFECKNRRIKCGNEHPQCSYCLSRNLICQYMPPPSSTQLAWPKIQPHSSTSSVATSAKASPSVVDPAFISQYKDLMASTVAGAVSRELNIQDLELMMQWCTTTYRSVSRNSTVECIWQAVVPREAMHHPFLMHGILALSALHLAFNNKTDTKDYYIRTSKSHRHQALLGLTRVSSKMKPYHCNAAFSLSSIMMIFAFGLPETMGPATNRSALDELHEVFQSTRESIDVMTNIIDCVGNGELGPLLEFDNNSHPKMPDTSRLAIMSLARLNANLARQNPLHEQETYDATIKQLGYSLDKVVRGGETMIIAFEWIFQVPSRYLELFRRREPLALVILAHYAVIMHSLRRHWWMGEWGVRLIREIGPYLNAELRNSISWVLDATGCYIPPI